MMDTSSCQPLMPGASANKSARPSQLAGEPPPQLAQRHSWSEQTKVLRPWKGIVVPSPDAPGCRAWVCRRMASILLAMRFVFTAGEQMEARPAEGAGS